MNLQIIIPFFNESKRVNSHIAILKDIINCHSVDIIYVDDGSSDNTATILEKELKTIDSNDFSYKVLIQESNQGKGFAVKRGVAEASSTYCLYTDFDFSIDPMQISTFYNIALTANGPVIVMASRRKDSDVVKAQSILRKLFGRVFNHMMKLIINIPFQDTQCGFKLFDTETAKEIFAKLETKGFAFDVEVIKRAFDKNVTIIEKGVAITNDDENSTVNIFVDPIKMLWELLKLRVSLSRSRNE
jgi:glycosyltransferase involved in cell wall biosynthesis